ncbi:unnamed protein product [Plutella xylostella]|uniref:(diamondback moth) hypothetical protein n=1 Tax=Plutella xylostella TaxID=51655 RepID=A0A8S4G5G2_PLUXY|nr:unnamed protein product [Plutella xylostella]
MGCGDTFCSQEKAFIFINIAFAMYSGALLATAARLAWDPSTYAWLRFLCAAQYRVSAGYVLAAGAWLAGLVYLAAAAAAARRPPRRRRRTAAHCLHLPELRVRLFGPGYYGRPDLEPFISLLVDPDLGMDS